MLFSACEEVSPTVTGAMGGDTGGGPVEDQLRQVLIEEFTGVRCVQCPGGAIAIEELLGIHGERLVAVSIHAGDFSPPYNDSQYDFRTSEGTEIINFLERPAGYPSAVVNRKQFDGQFNLQLNQGDWAGSIASELEIVPKVRINIEPGYDQASRELTLKVTLFVDEAITDPDVHLSIMITESGIVDKQLTPAGLNTGYVHKHALRSMLTNWNGDPIAEPLTPGAEIEKQYTFNLPEAWVAENCELVAFVSLAGTTKEVLQAHQVHLVE
ncbi:MAG: Omp28-related outer membrane protein [Saprospiraceae bacterium]|nr:Omp28-related outer membrane protein [Saprospiraceae bacterium]